MKAEGEKAEAVAAARAPMQIESFILEVDIDDV